MLWIGSKSHHTKKEMLEELEFFKYPHNVERSKEWLEGYNYCKEGVKETIEDLKNNN